MSTRNILIGIGFIISSTFASSWTGSMNVTSIDYSADGSSNNIISLMLNDAAGPHGPYIYWYDCQYGQCYNGYNTSDKAKAILSILLTAKTTGAKVNLFGDQMGPNFYFKGVSISN